MRKTSAMVEAGILAAVAIVMALISVYIPVVGVFVNFVWPLPIVICGMRHGLQWSVMTLMAAAIILAMIISPVNAFFLAVIFGLLGLVLGECMRRRLTPGRVMLYGSVGAVITLGLNFALSFAILGINPIEMMFSSFHESLSQLTAYYQGQGLAEAEIKKIVDEYRELLRMMRIIMPGAFLLCAPVLAFLNYWAARKILGRIGETFEAFPRFTMLQVPGWILWPYALSLFAVTYFYQQDRGSWMYIASVNIQTVCSFVLVLQGISLIYWYVESRNKPSWWANLAVAAVFVLPFMSQIIVYVGAFDVVFDWRRIRGDSLFSKR